MTLLLRAGLILIPALALAGCRGAGPAQKGAPPPPLVTVARPVLVPVQHYFEYNGHLETTQSVEIRARVKGNLLKVHFTEGTEVTVGQPLYSIDDREQKSAVAKATAEYEKATADIGNWKAQIKLAETELTRTTEAKMSGAGAQTDVDKAAATLDVNKAQLAAAVASQGSTKAALDTAIIQLGYTEIKAPIAGRINRTLVDARNLVGENEATLLTTIVKVDELFVYFDAPEQDLIAYQRAQLSQSLPEPTSREIAVEVGVGNEPGYPHVGKIDFRANRVDTSTGTVRLRGRIPNPLQANTTRLLYPGLYSRVRVPSAQPQPMLAIPEDAIQTGQEGRFVFVARPDNTVEKRLVTLGPSVWKVPPQDRAAPAAPGWALVNPKPGAAAAPGPEKKAGPPKPTRLRVASVVAVESGLQPDDRVIVNGLQRARPESAVNPDEWVLTPPKE